MKLAAKEGKRQKSGDISVPEATGEDVLRNLLLLADKYNVPKLKTSASFQLAQRLNTNSVLKTLKVACQLECYKLVDYLVAFIIKNRGSPNLKVQKIFDCSFPQDIMVKIVEGVW